MRRILLVLGLLLVAGVVAALLGLRHPLPEARPGPDGDALAKKVAAAVGAEAWEKLGAVRWALGSHEYLWDKRRGFVRVRLGADEVLLDLMTLDGRTFQAGEEKTGEEKKRLLDKAYKWFCNDSFWLNPLVKLFDAGTTRAALEVDGKPALLISYSSGGVTPGDSYLWLLDGDGHPRAWRVWASLLRAIPGLEFTWEDWLDVAGSKIATTHRVLGFGIEPISDVAGAERPELLDPGPDPFGGLAVKR